MKVIVIPIKDEAIGKTPENQEKRLGEEDQWEYCEFWKTNDTCCHSVFSEDIS